MKCQESFSESFPSPHDGKSPVPTAVFKILNRVDALQIAEYRLNDFRMLESVILQKGSHLAAVEKGSFPVE
jgi:hypothetical protein